MLEHAVYSVISPEGCASILWRTAEKAPQAAEAMKITAQDLEQLGVIDRIVTEPVGGAHRDAERRPKRSAMRWREELDALSGKSAKQLRRLREDRFLGIGERRQLPRSAAPDAEACGAPNEKGRQVSLPPVLDFAR